MRGCKIKMNHLLCWLKMIHGKKKTVAPAVCMFKLNLVIMQAFTLSRFKHHCIKMGFTTQIRAYVEGSFYKIFTSANCQVKC